jgi:hypothetical protein
MLGVEARGPGAKGHMTWSSYTASDHDSKRGRAVIAAGVARLVMP